MNKKTIALRILAIVGIAAVCALQIISFTEKGRITNPAKFAMVLAALISMLVSTFFSKIDSKRKADLEAEFEKEAVYFAEDKGAKRLFYRGFRGWFTNDYATAYYYLPKAAKRAKHPCAKARAHFYIGRCAVEEKKYGRAAEHLEMATQLDVTFSKAWSNLATAYSATEQPEKAKAACETGLLYNPQDPYLNSKIGDYYFSRGEYERAFAAFSEAERAMPKNPVLVMNTALAFAGLGDEKNAMARYAKAKLLGYKNCDDARTHIEMLLRQGTESDEER